MFFIERIISYSSLLHLKNNFRKFAKCLTHLCLASLLWDLGKQNSPRWGFSVCLEKFHRKMRENLKITPNTPKHESGFTQLIMMGKSIRQIWVKGTQDLSRNSILHLLFVKKLKLVNRMYQLQQHRSASVQCSLFHLHTCYI